MSDDVHETGFCHADVVGALHLLSDGLVQLWSKFAQFCRAVWACDALGWGTTAEPPLFELLGLCSGFWIRF